MRDENKQILILGGEGFIGRNISQVLSPSHECVSLGIEKSIFPERKDIFLRADPYCEKVKGDYNVFIHLIDNPLAEDDFTAGEEKLISNTGLGEGAHLVLFSSAAIYANPDSAYAKRKKLLEDFYSNYCWEQGINLTIFRLFNTYGDYQLPYRQGSLVANIFCNYLNGKVIEINDLEAKRDYIYARDIAKMVQYAIEKKYFETTDIGSGVLITLSEMIKLIEEKIIKGKLNMKDNNSKELAVSPEAKNDLLSKIDIAAMENGLSETFQFYKDNLELINNWINSSKK